MKVRTPDDVPAKPAFERLETRLLLSGVMQLDQLAPSDQGDHLDTASLTAELHVEPSLKVAPSGKPSSGRIVSIEWDGQMVQAAANQWIVRFAETIPSTVDLAASISSQVLTDASIESLGLPGFALMTVPGIQFEELDVWANLRQDILYIEPNFVYSIAEITHTTIPNDTSFTSLWGLHNTGQSGGTVDADIDAPEAWDLTTGSSDVVIGIIDTGIDYNHPDLIDNIWTNPGEIAGDGLDNDGNGYIDDVYGWDFVYGDNDPMDGHGHGTHVAGTIGAMGNNNIGVTGVNWDVQLMAMKFLDDDGYGSTSDAVAAINYATMMKRDYGVNVVATNNSWGGGGYSTALYDAIAAAGEEGILFCAAAGNGGFDGIGDDTDAAPYYPSSYSLDNIIAVAATDRNDYRAYFSNFGATSVDLAAPGDSIFSTLPGNSYASWSGTSMATPHVTGVVGLLAAMDPSATVREMKTAILTGTDPVSSMTGISVSGGRLNADGALQMLGISYPRILSITPPAVSTPVDTITIDFTASILSSSVVASNFLLRDNGPDGSFDTSDDNVFSFSNSDLSQPRSDQVDIDLGMFLEAEDYRLSLLGTGSNPIQNTSGEPLNDGLDEVYFFEIAPWGPFEPNDTLATATPTGLSSGGQAALGTATFSGFLGDGMQGQLDVDLYAFAANFGDTITADINAYWLGSSLDSILRLFDAAGNQLTYNDDTSGLDSFIQYSLADAGTYYVGVSGYSNFSYDPNTAASGVSGSTGDYELMLTLEPDPSLRGEIRGTTWYDLNSDGVKDPGEPGLPGWTIFLDLNDNGMHESQTLTSLSSTDVPKSISDFTATSSDLTITGLAGLLTDVDVTVDITHSWDADLEVFLNSPAGTQVELFTDVGGSGNNFDNTTLDDQASVPVSSGTAPFAGSFQPEGMLSDFDGEDPNGTWTLEVYDDAWLDTGQLKAWSITVTIGELSAQTNASGEYILENLLASTYTVAQVQQADWQQTFPASGSHSITIAGGEIVEGIDFGNRVPGDVDGDGWVSDTDLDIVITYWGQSLGREYGDLNGNGVVDGPDYTEVLSYWNPPPPPEPLATSGVSDNHTASEPTLVENEGLVSPLETIEPLSSQSPSEPEKLVALLETVEPVNGQTQEAQAAAVNLLYYHRRMQQSVGSLHKGSTFEPAIPSAWITVPPSVLELPKILQRKYSKQTSNFAASRRMPIHYRTAKNITVNFEDDPLEVFDLLQLDLRLGV